MSGNSGIAAGAAGDLVAWTFDPATGALSDRRVLNASFRRYQMYGGVFSPSGRRLYYAVLDDTNAGSGLGRFIQYDFDADAFTTIGDGPARYYFGDARRAPDGRIYVAGAMSDRLHVVDNPDAAGAAASFQMDAITPPSGCVPELGLPFTYAPLALEPPVITDDPDGVALFAGQQLSLSVTATGQSLTYQWRKDGDDITGADGATYTITAATGDAGSYDVVVTNSAGSATSAAATVVVHGPPVITDDPDGVALFAGEQLSLSVTATGQSLTYQWRKDGDDITGADGATYTITAATGDAGSYDVVVTNSAGSATSAAATVVVHGPPVITDDPDGVALFAGEQLSLSVTATGQSLTYQWRKDGDDITGADGATYTITAATGDAGSYDVVVTNPAGSATSAAASVVVHGPPAITTQPVDMTVDEGAAFTLTVVATGEQLAYQWRRDGTPLAGETQASLSRAASATGDAGDYDVVVANPAGSVTSSIAAVTVEPIDEPPPPPSDDPGGCGCNASRGPEPTLALVLLVLALVGRRSRRGAQPNVRSSRS